MGVCGCVLAERLILILCFEHAHMLIVLLITTVDSEVKASLVDAEPILTFDT